MKTFCSMIVLMLLPLAAIAEGKSGQTQNEATDTIRGFDVCEYFSCDMFVDHMAFNILSEKDHTLEVTNLWPAEMYADRWIYEAETLIIPEDVVYQDESYAVKSIGNWTFMFSNVKNLVIPPSVTEIKAHAFTFVGEGTKKVIVPSSVTTIEDYAFGYNEGEFPQYEHTYSVTESHVDTLQFLAETPCVNHTVPIKSVLIVPDGTRDRYRQALAPNGSSYTIYEAGELRGSEIALTPDDEDYWPVLGQDYAGDQTTVTPTINGVGMCEWFNCDFFTNGLAFNILSQEEKTVEVTNLHWEEVAGERWIYVADTIKIPEQVSFENEVYTVTAIGRGTFSGSYVHYVDIPETVTEIGPKAFSYVAGMEGLYIPNSVKTVSEYAFAGEASTGKWCPAKLIFGEGTKIDSLGVFAFAHRRGKEILWFPDYLTTVPIGLYSDNGMTELNVLSDKVEVISEEAFAENDFESIELPESLKEIGNKAFWKCKTLKSVTIPASVTKFGDNVFGSSSTQCFLDTLRFLSTTPPECHARWEGGATKYSDVVIVVPKGTIDLYREAWGLSLTTIIEADETTAIQKPSVEATTEESRYALDGRRLTSPTKGINIIRMSDGTVKKVIVKVH